MATQIVVPVTDAVPTGNVGGPPPRSNEADAAPSLAAVSKTARASAAARLAGSITETPPAPRADGEIAAVQVESPSPGAVKPPVVAQPQPAPTPTDGRPPSGQSPATPAIDPAVLSAEARAFVAKFAGGDFSAAGIAKALAKGLEYNNRNAELARELQTLKGGQAPAAVPATAPQPVAADDPAAALTADLAPPQAPPAAEPVVPEVTPEVIDGHVQSFVESDPVCVQLDQRYAATETRADQIRADAGRILGVTDPAAVKSLDLGSEIAYLTRLSNEADVRDDSLRVRDLAEQIRSLRVLQSEQSTIELQQQQLLDSWQARRNRFRGHVEAKLQKQVDAQRKAAERTAEHTRHIQQLQQDWTPTLDRILADQKVPVRLHPKYRQIALTAARAELNSAEFIPDLKQFLTDLVSAQREIALETHREESAGYGDLARQRTHEVAPPVSAAAHVAQPIHEDESLASLYARTRRNVARRL
jgi:hypothetical protein